MICFEVDSVKFLQVFWLTVSFHELKSLSYDTIHDSVTVAKQKLFECMFLNGCCT